MIEADEDLVLAIRILCEAEGESPTIVAKKARFAAAALDGATKTSTFAPARHPRLPLPFVKRRSTARRVVLHEILEAFTDARRSSFECQRCNARKLSKCRRRSQKRAH